MATVDASAGTPTADGTLDLVDAACRENLRKLTKEGGASDYASHFVGAIGFSIAAILAVVYIRLDLYNSTTISPGLRGWVRLAYWVLLISAPFCLAFAAWAFVLSKRVAASASLLVTCPGCSTPHELSDVHRDRFSFTCPSCYAVIVGSAGAYSHSRRCAYCGLVYFGGQGGDCPSCRGGSAEAACPHCKAAIPRGAIGCVSCNRWLVPQSLGESSDAITFGPKLARAYVVDIWNRISPHVNDLATTLKAMPDSRDVPPATANSVLMSLTTPRAILPNLALAAQWLQRPGVPAEPLPPSIAEGLGTFDTLLTRYIAGGVRQVAAVQEAVRTARRTVA